jgi:hypothetical protein
VIEVFINLYVLLINLNGVRAVWKRVIPHKSHVAAAPIAATIAVRVGD